MVEMNERVSVAKPEGERQRILFALQHIPSGVFQTCLEIFFLYNARGLSVCISDKMMIATPDGSCHCEAVKNYLCSGRHSASVILLCTSRGIIRGLFGK